MRKADRERLTGVLDHSSKLLRDALRIMILGNGPTGLVTSELLSDWWRRLELG
jgi:hypothetical protein